MQKNITKMYVEKVENNAICMENNCKWLEFSGVIKNGIENARKSKKKNKQE